MGTINAIVGIIVLGCFVVAGIMTAVLITDDKISDEEGVSNENQKD